MRHASVAPLLALLTTACMEYTVEVHVTGLVRDPAVFTLNGEEHLLVDRAGDYVFTTTLEPGDAYDVALSVPPAHHMCNFAQAAGVMPARDVVVETTCAPRPSTLLITEVGFGYYANDSYWVEIVNVDAQDRSLAGVTLRAPAYEASDGSWSDAGMREFNLPPVLLPAGEYLLVRGAIPGEVASGPGIALVSLSGGIVPHWRRSFGAVELREGGESIDYVAWGRVQGADAAVMAPAHPAAWPSYPAGLSVGPGEDLAVRGGSLARSLTLVLADSNSAADFRVLEFSTPGGPNDTHGCVTDADEDGLPDCAEAPGRTYAGVDLHAFGARPDKRDIFVEIDAMDPRGGDGLTLDPGMVPRREALERIIDVFAENDISLHFDVGDLFDQNPGIDPDDHDLGGGGQIPFSERISFESEPNSAWIYDLKARYFVPARLKSFHYAVFANRHAGGDWTGRAEMPGNDLFVTLGELISTTETEIDKNFLINFQAMTLMHELGHNLGLSHGGFSSYRGDALADEANWKPNYLSVMNYLHATGLPTIGAEEGDRYYFEHDDENPACAAKGIYLCTMTRSVCGDPRLFGLDFSRGLGEPIDVSWVVESEGLRQPGSGGVDFDCDGVIQAVGYASTLYSAVEGKDEPLALLRDHDDWGALDLFFAADYSGFNNSALTGPAERDTQPLAAVDPVPPAVLVWLRSR